MSHGCCRLKEKYYLWFLYFLSPYPLTVSHFSEWNLLIYASMATDSSLIYFSANVGNTEH